SARLPEGSTATLTYKVMFGADVVIPFLDDAASPGGAGDGTYGASIPGQAAGRLIRYRIDATAGAVAFSAPAATDSIRYQGVVVTNPTVTSTLPVIEWFMEDSVYADLLANHRCDDVTGDAVIAYNGTVYDGAKMKIRGQSTCTRPKPNWKVEMAPGHDMDFRPYMPYLLDEWALQRDPDPLTDIAWPIVGETGARDLALKAVRSQRNGAFWSVGRFMELEDGTWREAEGVKNWAIYKGDAGGLRTAASPAALAASLDLDKKTREDEDLSDVWALTQAVDAPVTAAQRAWIDQNIDIPVLVNYMAVNTLIRHQDSGWHNWFISRDTQGTGRWQMWHWDLNWIFTTDAADGKGDFLTPEGSNQLLQALIAQPDIKAMYARRLRTLADTYLPAGGFEARWDAIAAPYTADWNQEHSLWGTGTPASARASFLLGVNERRTTFAANTGPGKLIPVSQSATPTVVINEIAYHPSAGDDAEFIELTNPTGESVDLSGWVLDGVGLTIPPGTVLLPGKQLVFVAKDTTFRTTYPQAGVLVAGQYPGRLSDTGQTIRLLQGTRVVDEVTYSSTDPWPAAANGTGPSLELFDPGTDNALPAGWGVGTGLGTPGTANTATAPPDTENPTAPTGLTAELASDGVRLAWQAATDNRGVTGYRVLRDGVQLAAVGNVLSHTDSQPEPSTTHTYRVRAVDLAGNVGPDSAPVSVTTPAAVALVTEPFTGADGATWPSRWTTSATAGSVTVQGGTGRLTTNNTTGAQARAILSGLSARTDSDVTLSYRWSPTGAGSYFNVFSRGSGGWANAYRPRYGYGLEFSSSSTSVTVKRVSAGAVSTVQTVTGAQATSTATQRLRIRVAGSTIQFKTWLDGQAEPAGWRATVTDTTVTTPGQLHLSVARGSTATVARSVHVDDVVVSSATGTADLIPPSAPTALGATSVGQTQVGLTWQAATDDIGVTGYQVLRDGFLVGTPSDTAYTDTGLAASATYTYTVRAVDAAGNLGPASNAVTVTTSAASGELYATTFTGADGAAWPTGWTTGTAAGGTATIRADAGQLAFANTSGSYARAQLSGLAARADSDVTFSYRWRDPAAKGYLNVALRGSGGWSGAYRPANGYGLEFTSTSTSVTVKEMSGGTTTTVATLTNAQATTTATQWVRLRVVGSTVQVKTWAGGQAEPTPWRSSITDPSISAAGQVYLSYVRSSTATAGRAVDLDDLVVSGG
ncbi:MAG: CotH kinase family protein, partial [Kineosporiaceae bacterium]